MASATVTADCGLLYHYTFEEGLQGITEYYNIRATHVRFLNDYTEFRQAFQEEYVGALADAFREGLPEDLDNTARRVVEGMLSKRDHSSILGIIEDPAPKMREGLQSDIQFAGMRAAEYVHRVNEAPRRPAIIRWAAAGLVAGAALFAAGVYWFAPCFH